jgi:hypothetical protein
VPSRVPTKQEGEETVLGETSDPDGRRVQLTAERWRHILRPDGHPELAGLEADVLRAVEAPDQRRPSPRSNEEWYFLRDVGPSRWLQVVVVYEGDRGFIVTAFGRRKDP